ncbi:MAG: hypothetical protein EA422_06640 [Gemmatimonadales bacterium]|nr:MAG: hypothetical protein EA422_06640 [Gemmatimonadales bacterium]
MNRRLLVLLFLWIGLLFTATACGDDPFQIQWSENPAETTLYAMDRQELNRPSAFDMLQRRRVVLESPQTQGRWDFAVDRQGGSLVLLPPRALGVTSQAAIAPMPGVSFEELREAPSDTTLYITRDPVPLQVGNTYAVRTHEQRGRFGQICTYYGKLEVVGLRSEDGVLIFRHDTSPECNSRRLVPRNN